jgi:DNA-binding FrmR family transcriptional regulator
MLENGRSYEDLTVQMLSVINALKGLSNYLVREHLTKNVLPSLSEKELEECMYALNWLDKIK